MRHVFVLLAAAIFSCQSKPDESTSSYVIKQGETIYWAITPVMDSNAVNLLSHTLRQNGIFFKPFIDRDEQGAPVRIYGNLLVWDSSRIKPTDTLIANRLLMPDQMKNFLATQSIDVGHTRATLRIPPLGFWYDPKTGLHNDVVGENFPKLLRERVEKDFPATASAELEKDNAQRINKLKTALANGKPAFGFTLPDSSGRQISLSDYKGNVIYLDFWAHWCQPCMQEMKETKKLANQLKKYPDVVMLYVSLDGQADKSKWISAIKRNQFIGTHLLAAGGFTASVPRAYGVNEIPTKYIIDRNGNFFATKLSYPLKPDKLISLLEEARMKK